MTEPTLVIPDAGPLIALGKLGQLTLLRQLYSSVQTTVQVFREAVERGEALGHPDSRTLRLFLQRSGWPVVDVELLDSFPEELGAGERSVLSLSAQHPDSLLLIDDELARSEARKRGFETLGTLGVLVAATRRNLIDLEECRLLLDTIGSRPDIWISGRLCQQVWEALRG